MGEDLTEAIVDVQKAQLSLRKLTNDWAGVRKGVERLLLASLNF